MDDLIWKQQSEALIRDGYRRIVKRTFLRPDGVQCDFEVKDERDTVAVLALTPARQVICALQYRPGPDALLYELPSGAVEVGETPLEAARRELLEETG